MSQKDTRYDFGQYLFASLKEDETMAGGNSIFIVPATLASGAFVLSLWSGVWCKFLKLDAVDSAFGPPEPALSLHFGIWYYQWWTVVDSPTQGKVVLESCHEYPDYVSLDAPWRSARAFSVMASVIGGIVTFWVVLSLCLLPAKSTYRLGAILLMSACLFQGLSLLMLSSPKACTDNVLVQQLSESLPRAKLQFSQSCTLSRGADCAIAATVLWFLAALLVAKIDPPQPRPLTQQTQDVTYTRVTQEDGNHLISENVVSEEPLLSDP